MSLVVNHNLMAANVARNLNSHYANLSNSTQRLSTGLRVNSAADDAAGLAIRELQRADIAALHQGARNANDAISLIQVADGALQIIDEKLIRMKELAEQAATGTYDSTQRMMIESEYQAMASEITRIAHSTDFNGIHLLDGTLESDQHDGSGLTAVGKLKVHFGTGNDSAEDYYYIKIGESTAQAFGVGDASTWEDAASRISKTFTETLTTKLNEMLKNPEYSEELKTQIKVAAENWSDEFSTDILEFSSFTNREELSKLYTSFKYDDEVSELSDIFERYINDYDSIDDRTAQKMKYALGRAAMRSLAADTNIATGFGDEVNQYSINKSVDGILGNINYSAFSSDKNGAVISYNPNENRTLVYTPPSDYNLITYNSNTGENAPLDYPLTFTSPLTTRTLSNSLPGASGSYTFNVNGDLLSFTDASGTTLYNGSKIAGYKDSKGITTLNENEYPISYLDTSNNRTIFEGNADGTSNRISEYYANDGSVTTFHPNGNVSTHTDNETNVTTFNDDGSILSYSDKSNNVTTLDSSGNVIQYIDNSGNKTIIQSSGNLASYTDVEGNVTTFDAAGTYFEKYQDTSKNITEFDSSGKVTKFTDSNGNVVVLSPADDFTSAIVSDVNGTVVPDGDERDVIIRNAQSLSTSAKIAATAAKTAANTANTAATAAKTAANTANTAATAAKTAATTARTDANTAKSAATSYIAATTNMINDEVNVLESDFYKLASVLKDTLGEALSVAATSAEKYNYAGYTIATQEDAQKALAAINDAIEAKDKIRADLGAKQNRLENTISNLNIQAENLQAAESRISDVDVSTEMTEFVRQQILTQSAVAMLSQANSLPQMAMQLIGG